MAAVQTEPEIPWHAAYPSPSTHQLDVITREQLLELFKEGKTPGKDFALIDLRRTDFEGGTIHGAINLPAQSLYPTLPAIYTLLEAAKIAQVIWYCGSSRARGPRAAGWFRDYLDVQGNKNMKSLVLREGIRGWATAGHQYTQLMIDYDEKVWNKDN